MKRKHKENFKYSLRSAELQVEASVCEATCWCCDPPTSALCWWDVTRWRHTHTHPVRNSVQKSDVSVGMCLWAFGFCLHYIGLSSLQEKPFSRLTLKGKICGGNIHLKPQPKINSSVWQQMRSAIEITAGERPVGIGTKHPLLSERPSADGVWLLFAEVRVSQLSEHNYWPEAIHVFSFHKVSFPDNGLVLF